MGLLDDLTDAVATVDAETADLQPEVTISRWLGQDALGKPRYAAPVRVPAIVEWKQRAVRTRAGADTTSRAYVGILRPFSVSERDKVVLPDGTTGPILDMGGFVSRATGRPIFVEVWLG